MRLSGGRSVQNIVVAGGRFVSDGSKNRGPSRGFPRARDARDASISLPPPQDAFSPFRPCRVPRVRLSSGPPAREPRTDGSRLLARLAISRRNSFPPNRL